VIGKHPKRSKTLIVNAVATMLVVLELKWTLLQPYLPVNFYVAMSIGLPLINGVLRVITSQPITFTRGSADAE
jgi:hypothetical protein